MKTAYIALSLYYALKMCIRIVLIPANIYNYLVSTSYSPGPVICSCPTKTEEENKGELQRNKPWDVGHQQQLLRSAET